MLGPSSGSVPTASLPVRHFAPYHVILACPKSLHEKNMVIRLSTYDARMTQSQSQVERRDTLRQDFVVRRLYRSALSFLFPLPPFSIHFSTLPHSLPWRWCPVGVVELRRRQALDIGAFFLAPPHGIRVKVRDLHVRSLFRHTVAFLKPCCTCNSCVTMNSSRVMRKLKHGEVPMLRPLCKINIGNQRVMTVVLIHLERLRPEC